MVTKNINFKTYLKISISVFLCLIIISSSFSSVAQVIQNSNLSNKPLNELNNKLKNNTISVSYFFEKPKIEIINIGDTEYSKIIIHDIQNCGNPGYPKLPIKKVSILLPQGTKIDKIKITNLNKTSLGDGFLVIPAGNSIPITKKNIKKNSSKNEEIYNSLNIYPEKPYEYIDTYFQRGYAVATIALYPIQYIPFTGEIFYLSQIDIEIELVDFKKNKELYRGLEKDRIQIIDYVDNSIVTETYPIKDSHFTFEEDYDLLIITSEELNDSFLPLKQAHDAENIKTTIHTVEEIYQQCPGDDYPEQIRNFIRDEYNNHNITYVLIGGDIDTVPVRYLYFGYYSGEKHGPSDLYYACLDGSFNSDEDEYWGEPTDGEDIQGGNGDVDLLAEVSVGRACVDNASEVEIFVNKTIHYMNTDITDEYLRDFLMVGEYFCGPLEGKELTMGGDYMEELINGTEFYGTIGIPNDAYSVFNINRLYDRDWPGFNPEYPWNTGWPVSEIINQINNETHIINHAGHAGPSRNLKMQLSRYQNDIQYLTNNKHCFIYSQGCDAGAFDRNASNNPEEPIPDCIAEHLVFKINSGAFAGIWNARYGFYEEGSTYGDSQFYHREFWDAVFAENKTVISIANQDSKQDNIHRINFRMMRWCCYGLNYLGDPTISFKLIKPEDNIGIVKLKVLDHVKSDDFIYVNTTVVNSGINNQSDINISFFIENNLIESTTIPFFENHTMQNISFLWHTPSAGRYRVKINATVQGTIEEIYTDNQKSKMITVGVLNNNTDELFDTIQQAIDSPNTINGHLIIVPPGKYNTNLIINKNISLKGIDKDKTIIDGDGLGLYSILVLNTNFINITNLTIQKAPCGIYIQSSSNTTITQNNLFNNQRGITVDFDSNGNLIYHNNFNNTIENAIDNGYDNKWDNEYLQGIFLSGGNWWSDYNGSDNNDDGIGDKPYNISGEEVQDRYPLMQPYNGPLPTKIYVDDDNTQGPWYGTPDYPYQHIQDAIDIALERDTIFVYNGTYYENLEIYVSISLVGQDKNSTIIDGRRIDDVIIITIDNVNISGFTITNGSSQAPNAGILIHSNHNNIIGNIIRDNRHYGIFMIETAYNNISDNEIINNAYYGIKISPPNTIYNIVSKNKIINNQRGIIFSGSSNNTIKENIIRNNTYYGIYGSDITNNTITKNIITNSTEFGGIYLRQHSHYNNISGNIISDIENYALNITRSSNLIIFNNTIINNSGAMFIDNSNSNTIFENIVSQNYKGIGIFSSTENNISYNKINNNTKDGITISGSYYNNITGNRLSKNNNSGICICKRWSNPSYNNTIKENIIRENNYGIFILEDHYNPVCYNNTIYHNNFLNNSENAYDDGDNIWDDDFPSGGNFWSDYEIKYPDAQEIEDSGIWDRAYEILGGENQDRYPLMDRFCGQQNSIDPNLSFVNLTNENLLGLITCPAGDGPDYKHIKITVMNIYGAPIEGVSADDFEFIVSPIDNDTLWFDNLSCFFIPVDNYTNDIGEIRFNITSDTSIIGNITIEVSVSQIPINDVDVLCCKSVDVDCNGFVDLSDFVVFGQAWFSYDWICDFTFDGEIDLGDFILFASHWGH